MNSADLTTLYGAQMALEFDEIDYPNVFWPIRCLVSVTISCINNRVLFISMPPTSIENSNKPPGILGSSLFKSGITIKWRTPNFERKKYLISKTSNFFKQNENYFLQLLKNNSFWNSKELNYWIEWHKQNEWQSRGERFEGLVSKEFNQTIKSIGPLSEEQGYVIDVILRGYYYSHIMKGDIWLHPLRIENLPAIAVTGAVSEEHINPKLTALVLGALLECKGEFDQKLERWINLIKIARKNVSTGKITTRSNDELAAVASEMGLLDWETKINKFVDMIIKYSDNIKITDIFPDDEETGWLVILTIAIRLSKPILEAIGKYPQRKRIIKTISKGNRLLYLSNKFVGQ